MQELHYHCLYGEHGPLPAFSLTYTDLHEAMTQYLRFCRSMVPHSPLFIGAEEAILADDTVAWCAVLGPIKAILVECDDCDDPIRN